MQTYLNDIVAAVVFFPFLALLITTPYLVYQYRKYGSIPWWRTFVVYLVIFYLLCAYFQAILPLPDDRSAVVAYAAHPQLVPFTAVKTLFVNSGFVLSQPSTWISIFKVMDFYEIVLNILLTVPLGMFLRYYFRWSWWKCVLSGFAVSLFIEVSQITGLFGIYEHPYRLFDVDDLITNTFGALLGFWLIGPVIEWLPDMRAVNQEARAGGVRVSLVRRLLSFFIDIALVAISGTIFSLITLLLGFRELSADVSFAGVNLFSFDQILFGVVFFILVPIFTKGQTVGQKILVLIMVRPDGTRPKWYQYLLRYGLLFIMIAVPSWLLNGFEQANFSAESEMLWLAVLGRGIQVFLPLLTFTLLICWFVSVLVRNRVARKRGSLFTLLNEHLSGTRIMTVEYVKMLKDQAIVLNVEDVAALEQTIAKEGISLEELMSRAGHSVAEEIRKQNPQPVQTLVVCGSGNNGGDGWVVAHELAQAGYEVSLITPKLPGLLVAEPARSVAIRVFADVEEKGHPLRVVVAPTDEIFFQELKKAEIVVDAILGTGFSSKHVNEPYATWIRAINRQHKKEKGILLVSIDVPSGFSAQTGKHAPTCIMADTTITMIVYKPGLLVESARHFCGTIKLAHLLEIAPYHASFMQLIDPKQRMSSKAEKSKPKIELED